jgi:mannose-6-phosphate isomerase-like protein (cupin superfamily)
VSHGPRTYASVRGAGPAAIWSSIATGRGDGIRTGGRTRPGSNPPATTTRRGTEIDTIDRIGGAKLRPMIRRDFDPSVVPADGRPPRTAPAFDASLGQPWRGMVEGASLGGSVTVLTFGTTEVGGGPSLHVHPYDETFLVVLGRARFTVGDAVFEAGAGEVVFGPAGLPHRFENLGPGGLQTVDIHHSPRRIQTDLQ